MPTVDREGPEPLAIDRVAFKRALVCAICDGAFGKHHEAADAFMTGPILAPILAQADTAAQAVAERDEARTAVERLSFTDETGATWRPVPGWAYMALHKRATAAQAEVARLSAEVEALRRDRDEALSHLPEGLRDTSLAGAVQALAFSARSKNDSKWRWGHALTIGLAFADKAAGEEWEHGGLASVDVCLAMAAILGCDCDSDEWHEMVNAGAARLAEYRALAAGQDKTEGGKPSVPSTDAPAAAQEGQTP